MDILEDLVKEEVQDNAVNQVKKEMPEIQGEMVILEEMVIEDKMVHRVTLVEMDKMVDLETGEMVLRENAVNQGHLVDMD